MKVAARDSWEISILEHIMRAQRKPRAFLAAVEACAPAQAPAVTASSAAEPKRHGEGELVALL